MNWLRFPTFLYFCDPMISPAAPETARLASAERLQLLHAIGLGRHPPINSC
jgi:hypothetical protein